MIIGCGGAGKSTLARQLGAKLRLPVIHLDQEFWQPNWEEPEKTEWAKTVAALVDQPTWIIDGNYGGTMDIRLQKADTVIFMDRTRWLCLFRVLKRWWQNKGQTRPDMALGCHERITFEFLQYVFFYNVTRRPGILQKLAQLSPKQTVFHLRTEPEVQRFLLLLDDPEHGKA